MTDEPEITRLALAAGLVAYCGGEDPSLPWAGRLSPADRRRLRSELELLLGEPEVTGEPLDWPEVWDLLREYAGLAEWDGPLVDGAEEAEQSLYEVAIRPRELRALERAAPGVQRAARDLLARFLAQHPTDTLRLQRGRLKKMGDRGIWQIELPDGYRLRYFVEEERRTVHVVYLGPHPDGGEDGRERTARAGARRRQSGEVRE
jgi:mRNA-degrading endonuclease RelE of RelBE toxin-antitoxin system